MHVYAPAYGPGEVERLVGIADHIYFNSPGQIARHLATVEAAGRARRHPHQSRLLATPRSAARSTTRARPAPASARRWSRSRRCRGATSTSCTRTRCAKSLDDGSVGLIEHVARNLGPYVRRVKAVNFGGGHFINKPGYDVDKLIAALKAFRAEFGVEVILEPGAGLVVDTG